MIKAIIIQSPCDPNNRFNHFPACLSPDVKVMGRAQSVADGIDLVRKIRPNLVFLDVDIPGDSAFRVFEETAEYQYEKIILSEQKRHAIKAARYQVADYLLKPLCDEDFRGAVDRLLFSQGKMMIQQLYKDICCKRKQLKLEKIFIHTTDHHQFFLRVDSIIRIHDMGSFQMIITSDRGDFLVHKSLSRLSNALAFNKFFLVGQHLISLNYIQSIEEGRDSMLVIMEDGYLLPIPVSREHSLRIMLELPGRGRP